MPDANMHIINVSVFNNSFINYSVLKVHIKMPISPPSNDTCSKLDKY